VGQAPPDEFYTGLGLAYIPWGQQGSSDVGIPKVNQDYCWSLATDGRYVWWGTGGNVTAQASAQIGLLTGEEPEPQEDISDNLIPYRVWEYGLSQYPGISDELRPYLGDWRPPRIYQYDAKTNKLVDRTPNAPGLNQTTGLRAAGVCNGVALLCGLTLYQTGINVFAFDAVTGKFLGSRLLPQYSNIRRFVNVEKNLFTSVQCTNQDTVRGKVLKWTGTKLAPFSFAEVGNLDNEGSYLTYHDGRLFVGTWPTTSAFMLIRDGEAATPPPPCGVWMSPKLVKTTGLSVTHATQWKKVWDISYYEVDPSLLLAHSMGAMESFGGSLYFGTLNYPNQGEASFIQYYGFPPPQAQRTERPLILVRGKGYGKSTPPTHELLYASEHLRVFTPDGMGSGTWNSSPGTVNATGGPALYGGSGFGNNSNRYHWSSTVYKNVLYFGTFDSSTVGAIDNLLEGDVNAGWGADLWAFPVHGQPAVAVDIAGLGNQTSHGVRNIVNTSYGMFLGMANSANLLGDLGDAYPDGGWKVLKYNPPNP
jgi:hypothetical protein